MARPWFARLRAGLTLPLLVLALLYGAASLHAQTFRSQPGAKPAPLRGFLWEARRGDESVLLAATIHVGRSDFFPLGAAHLKRVAGVRAIAFEADIFNAQATAAAAQRWAMYAAGEPGLDTRIDPALRTRIEKIATGYGLQRDALWRMKPWMLANTLVILEAVKAGFNPAYGTEAFLHQYAQELGVPIVEIEGIEAQLRLFDEAPPETQFAYLGHAVESIERGGARTELEQLVDGWARRDVQAMERLLRRIAASPSPAERFVYERVVIGRHPQMLEAIERYAASGKPHLVAVGALHFFGPQGLLEGLRGRGFSITPVS